MARQTINRNTVESDFIEAVDLRKIEVSRDDSMPQGHVALLEEAFERFHEAGARLEERYTELQRETDLLRLQLAEKDREVKRAERLATLGEMAAAVAHEVRNPLGAIKLYVSLVKQDLEELGGSLDLVNQIDRSITSLDRVVSNILQFSSDKDDEVAPINIHSIINEQIVTLKNISGEGLRIVQELSGNPFLCANEHSLRQVFYNLFYNAMQALKDQGELRVQVEDFESDVKITVSDDGPGVAEEVMEKVFDPFVTTRQEGTGLGLAIVKKIVTQHGGQISVRNDKGAVFEIVLPRSRD